MTFTADCSSLPFLTVNRFARIEEFNANKALPLPFKPIELPEFVWAIPLPVLEDRSAALQEWLECKDFILCMKGIHLGQLPVNTDSLRHYKVSVHDVIESDKQGNKKIAQQLNEFNKHWTKAISAALKMAGEVEAQIGADIDKLNCVALSDKREVLRHMQIISTPIASAYLGISADTLHKMKKDDQELFGEHYAGGHCYSMEELNLIARNQHWAEAGLYADEAHTPTEVDVAALDQVVLLDEQVAIAFTNMTSDELAEHVPHTALARRPYRLADLEKARVAKLNQSLA